MTEDGKGNGKGWGETPASWTVRYLTSDGFPCRLTLRADTGQEVLTRAKGALDQLRKDGCQADQAVAGYGEGGNGEGVPLCPTHHKRMKASTKGGGWFCPQKVADDDGTGKPVYCKQTLK